MFGPGGGGEGYNSTSKSILKSKWILITFVDFERCKKSSSSQYKLDGAGGVKSGQFITGCILGFQVGL